MTETVIDARGHRCPVPTLRLRRALEGLGSGEVVRLLADDPMAKIDVPHFAGEAGHEVLILDLPGYSGPLEPDFEWTVENVAADFAFRHWQRDRMCQSSSPRRRCGRVCWRWLLRPA